MTSVSSAVPSAVWRVLVALLIIALRIALDELLPRGRVMHRRK